ncbi:uncharacterized protein E0L32_006172 [Thyridium curvatum]|uniref:Maleylacetoacetate isomerase n=1 Tax=Thyridium curvatum TaxID=1093900 RepID=A0A507ATY6_9PEZI|nr:uncharacterized protein E0L32_006172 [Thyridium curvatum]TPX13442.1 hypothetical protein E0L32_006172 [Thyridium curvatum]
MIQYTLYSFWRSSCSARLRIALNFKGIPFDVVPVNLLNDEHKCSAHKSLNPSASVPLLVCSDGAKAPIKIGQSLAAIEYLEEAHPQTSLLPLPSDVHGRAIVRALANIITCDIQPVTNVRILKRVGVMGGDQQQWSSELMAEGLGAYEAVAALHAGQFSYGNSVTLADVCLLPAVWNARRFGVAIDQFPTILRVAGNLEVLDAVQRSTYSRQPDTPEQFRSE